MGKRGRSQKKGSSSSNRRPQHEDVDPQDMDDEIDTFHKQRDVIPLDMNEDFEELDEDDEQPVLDFKDSSGDEDCDKDEDSDDDDTQLHGVAAKIARTQKFLRAKFGGVEEEMHDEEDEEKKTVWGGKKSLYYEGSEVSSSEEEEEEAEVLRLQKEKAKNLSMEDFGLEDVSQDDNDGEPEEILVKGKVISKSAAKGEAEDDRATDYEEVKKDVNALSKEEQMDVVYSSAPELVGLLSELSDAVKQLESVILLISKVKEHENTSKGEMRYLEVKQLLLLAYCQAITFYLLLKSEGQAVRDHPIIARLVEVKGLLDKMKELDRNLPCELEEILNKYNIMEQEVKLVDEEKHDSLSNDNNTSEAFDQEPSIVLAENKDAEIVMVDAAAEKKEEKRRKHQADQVGVQSMQMLKVRAALEQKLKNKGIFNNTTSKPDGAQKCLKPLRNGQLETFDDFDDEVEASQRVENGRTSQSIKIQQLVTAKNKPKIISGDDDLPKRDDIGERRRKHELRVLASAGIETEGDVDGEDGDLGADGSTDMEEDSELGESEDEFYKQVKKQRTAKLAEKADIYSRTSAEELLPEVVDGKRHITQQMEKNRGLTRSRKKLNKNPRKKYRNKHQKAVVRRKGQVREIRKPTGPYGGEATGINTGISRSIRFKN